MDTAIQIIVSGLTLGAMYAISALSLSLIWGSLNLLNMAQGALLTIGGYVAFTASGWLGLPAILALLAAVAVGALLGFVLYHGIVRFLIGSDSYETNVIIATVGASLVLENLVLRIYGAYPVRQPLTLEGGFTVGLTYVPWQNLVNLSLSVILLLAVAWFLSATRAGRAIRATAQNREAARMMGVPITRIFVLVLMIGGALAAVSGIMLSTVTTLAPTMGYDPMLKAFIICVVAGLGNNYGTLAAAFLLGLIEAAVQYFFGVRFAFPALLVLVIIALIWRPNGLFGRARMVRL